ncbi:C-GCAxxG-C-C family protein [Spirochaeta dissipatitropha]
MTKSDIAAERFSDGYNCAQSVIYAFNDRIMLDTDTAMKVSCCFGAGMGRQGEVCGAVTGGIMLLGLMKGRGEGQDRSAAEPAYAMTRNFMENFRDKHGSYICRELLEGCDLTTESGWAEFNQNDLKSRICEPCVRDVVQMLEDMLSS